VAGGELLKRLQARYPGAYSDGQLRTLQRRLKIWRGEMARDLIFGPSAERNSSDGQSSASRPDSEQAAIALAAVKDKPFGWPRERGHP
jgi:hypothetical protein